MGMTIAFDFGKTGKFAIERGKNLIAIHAYVVTVWVFDMSLIDLFKTLRGQKPPEPGKDKDKKFLLN
jgi:hypothetical protein